MSNAFFYDLLASIADRGRSVLKIKPWPKDGENRAESLVETCQALVAGRGEASGVALAAEILRRYRALDPSDHAAFFGALAEEFGPDRERVMTAIANYGADFDQAAASEIHYASEPRRHDLFRRLNRAPGGTAALVEMRADLLQLMNQNPSLAIVDRDFLHLFGSWFNRGFLVLRRIDWSSPAALLEKIIRYEAVHEIGDWDELRRRIDPADRRCYAFFHPRLIDEPLIFVEVALTLAPPAAIAPLLAEKRAQRRSIRSPIASRVSPGSISATSSSSRWSRRSGASCRRSRPSSPFRRFPDFAHGWRRPRIRRSRCSRTPRFRLPPTTIGRRRRTRPRACAPRSSRSRLTIS
jgi:malonyl-CoA decarboxylase